MMQKDEVKIGKFILDSLAIGMYNDPLMVIREYIQNSVDAIDQFNSNNGHPPLSHRIDINIDILERSLSIKDNAGGIPYSKTYDILHSVGESTKLKSINRGFRGIGRLGGLGYCDELKFITKAKKENIYSVSRWDCNKLQNLIGANSNSHDALHVIKEISSLTNHNYDESENDHFFLVEMSNVKNCMRVLLDVPRIKKYLSQVAPVPFNKSFKFAELIDLELKKNVNSYSTYQIFVNGEQIFKPYANSFSLSTKHHLNDEIKDIDFVNFQDGDQLLAYGWIGQTNLFGTMNSSNLFDGIRLRSGNILVGDKSLLSKYYKENRFNNYLVGEIHVAHEGLVLNSRRDDFEDNIYKEKFYHSFIREVGIPYSKKIRQSSETRSIQNTKNQHDFLIESANKIINNGYYSEQQKNKIISDLKSIKENKKEVVDKKEIENVIDRIEKSKNVLKKLKCNPKKGKRMQKIFDIIYKNCSNKSEAEKIVAEIINLK